MKECENLMFELLLKSYLLVLYCADDNYSLVVYEAWA